MLENVVEHDVIQRQDVFHLDVSEPVLGRRQIAEGVRDEDSAVVALDAVQQPVNAQTDRRLDCRLIHRGVRRPSANLFNIYFIY